MLRVLREVELAVLPVFPGNQKSFKFFLDVLRVGPFDINDVFFDHEVHFYVILLENLLLSLTLRNSFLGIVQLLELNVALLLSGVLKIVYHFEGENFPVWFEVLFHFGGSDFGVQIGHEDVGLFVQTIVLHLRIDFDGLTHNWFPVHLRNRHLTIFLVE